MADLEWLYGKKGRPKGREYVYKSKFGQRAVLSCPPNYDKPPPYIMLRFWDSAMLEAFELSEEEKKRHYPHADKEAPVFEETVEEAED